MLGTGHTKIWDDAVNVSEEKLILNFLKLLHRGRRYRLELVLRQEGRENYADARGSDLRTQKRDWNP